MKLTVNLFLLIDQPCFGGLKFLGRFYKRIGIVFSRFWAASIVYLYLLTLVDLRKNFKYRHSLPCGTLGVFMNIVFACFLELSPHSHYVPIPILSPLPLCHHSHHVTTPIMSPLPLCHLYIRASSTFITRILSHPSVHTDYQFL